MRWYVGTRVFRRFYVGLSGNVPQARPGNGTPGDGAVAMLKLLAALALLVLFVRLVRGV